jgi:hypothetical protein
MVFCGAARFREPFAFKTIQAAARRVQMRQVCGDASMRADPLAPDDAERARARDGNAFRTIIKEVTNGTGSFDFYQ